jgi:disulfide oxidoreductase YuzD
MSGDATVGERPEVAEVTKRAYLEFAQSSDPAFWSRYEASTREVLLQDDEFLRVVVTMDDRIVATGAQQARTSKVRYLPARAAEGS